MKRKKAQNSKKNSYSKQTILFILFSMILLAAGGFVLAKYYAKESRKGVSTASGLYFTSNCLKQVDSVSDKTTFPEYLNTEKWLGVGACTIPIHVNNYENILLYNDENLNITYDISFCLLDEPVAGSKYEVVYTDTSNVEQRKVLTKDQTFTISGEYLKGGSAVSNLVSLIVTPESGIDKETYKSGRVAVWAVPTYPSYVANTYKLAAIVRATPSKGDFTYTAGFEIAGNLSSLDWETEGKKTLDTYSGFVYNIKTSGESQGVTHFFEITWNTEYLNIDMYNSYYSNAISVTEDTVAKTKTMKIEAVSYTSMNFNFYKTENFHGSNFQTVEDFLNTVTVKDIIVGANSLP